MTEENISNSSDTDNIKTFEIKNDLQKIIVDAFSLFTSDNINSIPITDLGKVIRYLGCVPTEEELNEFTNIVENRNAPNTVDKNLFVPHMEKQIRAFKYKPGTADELLQAFHTLDTESKGSFSVDFMQQALLKGDSLDPEDITEAIKTAYDPDFQCIQYDIWIHKLLGKTKMDPYALATNDVVSTNRAKAEEDGELNRLLLLSSENNDIDPAVKN
ncbi:PREDICTED: EF-hand calcium-binding domain-containing protein 2-like [Diuraphis noxia]|uniref:EF-hand calcium-binding domain-containing protein 2-like n=1 Tax=Diuraphis noxia TaxID=143948 RepID=UPI0007637B6A|nr:PREDICTED: EF-hand calcium-binding domain-containing protein 2-like [Diuraphis noxia]